MQKTNIKQLEAGAKLAADVVGDTGHILLRAGTELSIRHISLLQSRGVTEVHIGSLPELNKIGSELAADEIDSIINTRFRKVDTHQALISALMDLCRTRLQ